MAQAAEEDEGKRGRGEARNKSYHPIGVFIFKFLSIH